jgi:hypothetical protein
MKLKLKGRRFDSIEEIQAKSTKVLDTNRKGGDGEPLSTYGREVRRG